MEGQSMNASEIPIQAVSRFEINAVLEAVPLPPRPEFDGAPLTLARLDDKEGWGNNGRRRKARAVWERFVAEANQVTAERNERLLKLLLVRGVALEVPPMAEWSDLDQAGVDEGSVSPWTRKLLYIHHLLPEADQKLELLVRIMEKSGLNAQTLGSVQALFREALGAVKVQEG
jgi:hypothetical protein